VRKYRNYTNEDIVRYSKEVNSIASLLKRLELKPSGGNYANIKNNLQKLKIDTSHWTGQGWNKDQQLKDWTMYSRVRHLKKHLIKEKSHQCEKCLLTTWLEQNIVLEVHHKDGNRTNNNFDNLQLLCCNCHAQTDNWRNKKITK
jgi:5-methylcytosine-specific restriction endonuclease McrA